MTRPDTHPARERMLAAGRHLPGVWDAIAAQRAESPPTHPCMYVSDGQVAEAVLQAGHDTLGAAWVKSLAGRSPLDIARLVQPYTMYAAWRMTQGIYRIDPTLYADLVDTEIAGDLPSDVLMHLPEWCIYIETPGLQLAGVAGGTYTARGAWCRTHIDSTGPVLVIAMDVPEADTIECQHVVRIAVADLLQATRRAATKAAYAAGKAPPHARADDS